MSGALVALFLLLVSGCGDAEPELREWQPSDHQMPHQPLRGETRAAPPDPSAQSEDPAAIEQRAAAALFRALCGACHGASGRGDGPNRPPGAFIPDLTAEELQASRTDADLASAIRSGRPPWMPAFGDRLSPQGIEALVRHVRRLGGHDGAPAAPSAAAPTPTSTGPTLPGENGARGPVGTP